MKRKISDIDSLSYSTDDDDNDIMICNPCDLYARQTVVKYTKQHEYDIVRANFELRISQLVKELANIRLFIDQFDNSSFDKIFDWIDSDNDAKSNFILSCESLLRTIKKGDFVNTYKRLRIVEQSANKELFDSYFGDFEFGKFE